MLKTLPAAQVEGGIRGDGQRSTEAGPDMVTLPDSLKLVAALLLPAASVLAAV